MVLRDLAGFKNLLGLDKSTNQIKKNPFRFLEKDFI